VWRAFFSHRGRDERGAEFAAALFVFPVLFILIIGCIEIGFYVQTRMRVENVLRDAARSVAADGGDWNHRTGDGTPISLRATDALNDGTHCKLSQCDSSEPLPSVKCNYITRSSGVEYQQDFVNFSGETVTCKLMRGSAVGRYPYRPLAAALMEGPLGLGIGNI